MKLGQIQRKELGAILSLACDEDALADAVSKLIATRDEGKEALSLIANLVYTRGDDCSEHITIAQEALGKMGAA